MGTRSTRLIVVGLVVGLAGLSVSVVAPVAGAASLTVTNCNDSGTGSLRQALLNATTGDTVSFALSPVCAVISLKSTIVLTTNVTISGPGATSLTASEVNYTTDFSVPVGVTATISGLTIEGGSIGVDNAGTFTLSAGALTTAGSSAGGGMVNSGTLAVTNSTLSGNGVTSGAGAGGGAIDNVDGHVTISGSTVSDNTASAGASGAGIDNDGGTVSISGSTISGNDASEGNAGGILNQAGGTLSVTTSTLADNSAVDGTGGAIENDSGTATITDSTLWRNTAFYGLGGGALFNAATATVANSTFVANGATFGGDGGAVYNSGTLSLTGTTFDRNTSTDDGGALFAKSGTLTVDSTILASSKRGNCFGAVTDGGANLSDDSTCGFTATTDHQNVAADLDATGLESNGGPTRTVALNTGSPAIGAVTSATLCSTPDQRGVARPTPCDTGAVDVVLPPQVISSVDTDTVTVDDPLTFTVTASGSPTPTITRAGKLPKHLILTNNKNGTSTLSGTPIKVGTYHLTFKATYGKSTPKVVATQAFTLVVVS